MKRLVLNSGSRHQNITSLASDSLGNIYAGTSKGKIFKLNKNLEVSFTYSTKTNMEVEYIYPYQDNLITSTGIFNHKKSEPIINAYFGKGVTEDNAGNFVVANYNLAGLIPKSLVGKPNIPEHIAEKPTVEYITNTLEIYIFRNKRARVVHYSKLQKAYFVGFSDGLYRFGLDGSVFEVKTPTSHPVIASDIYETPEGLLWVASTQNGLFCIEEYQVIKHFNSLSGLSSNKCKKIQADHNGIWIITDESLDYFDFENQVLQNYGNNLGLNGININDFYVNEEYIWFATSEGLIYFPKKIVYHNLSPFFEINLTQNDGFQLFEDALIPYSKNELVVEFKSVLYTSGLF